MGVLRSIVVFDPEKPARDGRDDVVFLDGELRQRLMALTDFTNADPAVNRYRFCTYHGAEGVNGCGKCISFCPAGALANSSPSRGGTYAPDVASQTHRFNDGALQFDFGRCCDDRGQLASLYDEWMCGRCVSICGGEGNRSRVAADSYAAYLSGSDGSK